MAKFEGVPHLLALRQHARDSVDSELLSRSAIITEVVLRFSRRRRTTKVAEIRDRAQAVAMESSLSPKTRMVCGTLYKANCEATTMVRLWPVCDGRESTKADVPRTFGVVVGISLSPRKVVAERPGAFCQRAADTTRHR